jgi:hypothetical protein
MLFNIILLFIVLYVLTHLLTYSKSFKEGFFNVPVLPPEHNEFVESSKTKFNPLTSMVNLTDPSFHVTPASSQQMTDALSGLATNPVSDGHELEHSILYQLPNEIPEVLRNASVCQKAPNTCAAFDNKEFADNCGMSFDIGGTDSNGKPHVGGLYISPDDRAQQERVFKNVEENGSAPYDPYKVYQPTLGTAAPGTYGITKDSCRIVKEKVDCKAKQSFNSPHCTQCFTSQEFSRVGPKTGKLPSTLNLVGKGSIYVRTPSHMPDWSANLDENTIYTIPIPADSEGIKFLITVRPNGNSPPTYLAGYLSGPTARGTFRTDIMTLIQTDTQTQSRPRMLGTKRVSGFRCFALVPGTGKTEMSLACLMPLTFINMYDGDSLSCENGPIITKESSATFLESDPCFGKANKPGNYKMECLQSRWMSLGGTPDGLGYPRDSATANRLQKDANGNALSIDDIVDSLTGVMVKALTGKDEAGNVLSIPDWNAASMYATGVPINTPCDGPGGQPPLSQQCLSYLYSNKGRYSHIGPTYSLPPNLYASRQGEGFDNPGDDSGDGFENPPNTFNYHGMKADPAATMAGQPQGGIEAAKQSFDQLNRLANDNTKKNGERRDAIQKAYGVVLGSATTNKNDFDIRIPAGRPTKSYSDMKGYCESQGKRLCESTEICDMGSRTVIQPELTSEFPGDNWIAVGDEPNEWLTLNRGDNRYCKTHTQVAGGKPGWGDKRDPAGWERLAKCCSNEKKVQGRYIRLQYDHRDCLNLAQIYVYTDNNDSSQIIIPQTRVTRSSAGYWGGIFPERNVVNGAGNTFVHTSCGDVPWMMVDLGAITPIYRVVLKNRNDCCQERVLGTSLIILNEQMAPLYHSVNITSVNMSYTWFPPDKGVYPDMQNGDKPDPAFTSAGCWKDTGDRAVPPIEWESPILDFPAGNGNYKARTDAINKCYRAALSKGAKVFAVQDGGWCAASTDPSAYMKYGQANNCSAGKGGAWANNVYRIGEDKEPAPKKNIYGNNGSTTCERYCSGVAGVAWNSELPHEWNGAACAGHSSDIKDCYSNFSFQPGKSSCVCQQTGSGWRQGGWIES